jgi:TolB protein
MAFRRIALVALGLVVLTAGCRESSEIRPAFTREKEPEQGVLDGSILFASRMAQERGGDAAIFTLAAAGGRPAPLFGEDDDEHETRGPAVSPDGRRVAFAVIGDEAGIWVSDLDGSGRRLLTDEPGFYDNPTWSPGGSRIAYAYSDGPTSSWDLFVVESDGGGGQRLTSGPAQDWYPAWSPDGNRIAFTSDRDGDDAIWMVDADGGRATKLVDGPEEDAQPAWSPDGSRIAFASNRELDRWQIWAYDIAERTARNLLRTDATDRFPAWSPDGTYLLTSVGYLAVYRADGERFENNADRWKLTDRLTLTSTWTAR